MGQLQNVSWRTVGYSALGTAVAAASVIAVFNSDGVHPTSLTSSAATKWLVDNVNRQVVLVDGLADHVVAKVQLDPQTDTGEDVVAVQGAGGAFLIDTKQASVRTISTSKLQLGTPQTVAILNEPGVMSGVGPSGLTILSPNSQEARVVAVDDVTREVKEITPSTSAKVAFDGSIWLFTNTSATHVTVDKPNEVERLRNPPDQTTTLGGRAVTFDSRNEVIQWSDGSTVPVDSIPNASEARLQEPGDDASCVWLAAGDNLACVGRDRIETRLPISGLRFDGGAKDRLAVSGSAAVVVRANNEIDRIDLEHKTMATDATPPSVESGARLSITATGSMVWIDDTSGTNAWVVHRLGINPIDKNDKDALTVDAQGQQTGDGAGGPGDTSSPGSATGDQPADADHLDHNATEDPPVAVPDSVTARAGSPITIPVTGNDYDPDGDPIAVVRVGDDGLKPAGHGATDVLSSTTVTYRPEAGFSGTDTFEYRITDPAGETATAMVSVELFAPGSPNQPPIARNDRAKTRPHRPVTIDVLSNDIDPERDQLTVGTFTPNPNDTAKITDTTGPSGLPALLYDPPDQPGFYEFTYQAADPQGGLSPKTTVTVEVSGTSAPNEPPVANPDSIRLSVGVVGHLDVKANDTDPNGQDLFLVQPIIRPAGVDAQIRGQQLDITLGPGAQALSVIDYTISAGPPGGPTGLGHVLVVRVGADKNGPPVANADAGRVVTGNSVKIPVTANDVDPDLDPIRLLTVTAPSNGAGTTAVEGNSVRFTPTLEDLTEPTPVTFQYTIDDGQGHEATGKVTVTVLLEALPAKPFARDDFGDTVVDKPVTIDVLANDSDPSGGQPNLAGAPSCPGGGSAARTSDERVVFTPPDGSTGTFRCKYTVTNQQGLQATASIIVTVTTPAAGNHPPTVIQGATNQQANLGEPLTLRASDIASDVDPDTLVFTFVDNPTSGSTAIGSNAASFTYTPPPPSSAEKVPQSVNVRFTISDGHDGNVSDTISIKLVNPTGTTTPGVPPTPIVRDILRAAFVGDTVQVDVVKELRDANPGTTLTLKDATYTSGPGSVPQPVVSPIVTIVTTGAGDLVANYTVTNTEGGNASAQIKVTVSDKIPANPPVAVNDQMLVASGGSGSVDVLLNDQGITDPGDAVQVGLVNRPPSNFGTVELSSTGVMTFVATTDASGVVEVTYSLTDGTGVTSSARVSINLLPCGESSPAVRDANLFTPYQTPISIDLNQFVLAGSIRPGSSTGAGLNGASSGVYTPPPGMNGTETVTYVVQNGCHQTVEGHLAIDVNRSPVAGTVSRELPRGGPPLVLSVTDLASDDEPLAITSLTGNPSWVNLVPGSSGSPGSFDNATISANPPPGTASGTYTMHATVQDPGGLTAVATINLILTNIAPTAVADAYRTDQPSFTFDPTANDVDPEGGQLCLQTVAVTSGSGSAVVSPDPNNPPPGCNSTVQVSLAHGETTLAYTIRDDGGLTSSSTISIVFNHAPSVANARGATNGQPSVDVEVQVTEPDGDPVTLTCNNGPNANPDFSVSVAAEPGSGADPATQPRFTATVTVLHPFLPPATIPCVATDSFGVTSNVGTITIDIIDAG